MSESWPESAVREVAILNEALENCEETLKCERDSRRIVDKAIQDALEEVDKWVTRCRNLTDPNPGGWTEALKEARTALENKDAEEESQT